MHHICEKEKSTALGNELKASIYKSYKTFILA